MIYPHQQRAIEYITRKMEADPEVSALLISGSIAHGYNDESSDVDINIVVPVGPRGQGERNRSLLYWEDAAQFYPGGYFDGKIITLDDLDLIARCGNEPTRFALCDAIVAFDRTCRVKPLLDSIGVYDETRAIENAPRFLAQLDAWKWYGGEALRRKDAYLLRLAAQKLTLFAGRLILLENRIFFPFHKWFMRTLAGAPVQPDGLMESIERLLETPVQEHFDALYDKVRNFRDWTGGQPFEWPRHHLRDVETLWTRGEDCVDHL